MFQNGTSTPLNASGRGRRFLFAGVLLALLPLSLSAQTPAPSPSPSPTPSPSGFYVPERTVRKLADGVEWIQEITPPNVFGGPLLVNVVRIAPGAAKKDRLRAALGYGRVWENNASQGREVVSGIAARNNALVAVNAGFFTFTSGHPIGLHLENGEAVTEPALSRTALCIDEDGKGSVAAFTGSGTVTAEDGATFVINGFNRRPGKGNELLLFSPRFFDATLPTPNRTEVQVSGVKSLRFGEDLKGTVSLVGTGGGTLLPPQTVVLSGGGRAGQFLQDHATSGKKITIRYDVTPSLQNIRQAVTGGPGILQGGKIALNHIAEGFGESHNTTRHPRTAAGVMKDGTILLLTVDGRQPFLSRGASLTETANLLLKFGAVNGVNLDGGGSSAMAVRGLIVNSVSGSTERAVANALVLVNDKPLPKSNTLDGTLSSAFSGAMRIGAVRAFALPSGINKKTGENTIWSVTRGVGFVSQSGVFVALRGGTGSVIATLADGRRFTQSVTVFAPVLPSPSPSPNTVISE